MHLNLTDDEAAALTQLLKRTIDGDRYPLSPRIRTPQNILDKIEPPPVRAPLPSLETYTPPHVVRGRRRR
jgi:hypothetical protein